MGSPAISEWLDMMPDTVTLTAVTGRTNTGEPKHNGGAVSSYSAHIEMKNHLIVDKQGRQVMARGRVTMATTDTPDIEALLTLPAGYVPLTPPIIAVNIVPDDTGSHHVVLEIG